MLECCLQASLGIKQDRVRRTILRYLAHLLGQTHCSRGTRQGERILSFQMAQPPQMTSSLDHQGSRQGLQLMMPSPAEEQEQSSTCACNTHVLVAPDQRALPYLEDGHTSIACCASLHIQGRDEESPIKQHARRRKERHGAPVSATTRACIVPLRRRSHVATSARRMLRPLSCHHSGVARWSVCLVFINHPCPKMGAAASGSWWWRVGFFFCEKGG
jgi:hypothetical protein